MFWTWNEKKLENVCLLWVNSWPLQLTLKHRSDDTLERFEVSVEFLRLSHVRWSVSSSSVYLQGVPHKSPRNPCQRLSVFWLDHSDSNQFPSLYSGSALNVSDSSEPQRLSSSLHSELGLFVWATLPPSGSCSRSCWMDDVLRLVSATCSTWQQGSVFSIRAPLWLFFSQ